MNKIFISPLFCLLALLQISDLFALNSETNTPATNRFGSLTVIAEGLDFPSNIVSSRDGSNRVFVLEKTLGVIRSIKNNQLTKDIFLDIKDLLIEEPNSEQGLLGLAFSPSYSSNKEVFVTYIKSTAQMVLSRFQVSNDGTHVIKNSEKNILTLKPHKTSSYTGIHYCGHIEFDPKGKFLYFCVGDMDENGSPRKTSQKLNLFNGKMLRLDVSSGQEPYAIPKSNPFVGQEGVRPEIWAFGLRNPWRFSFDSLTNDLYIPDVGHKLWEEINFQSATSTGGQNYGWHFAEGNLCHWDCSDKKLTWPFYEYYHGEKGCAVIGGAVYRGKKYPQWQGMYIFSDYCTGAIWASKNIPSQPEFRLLLDASINPTAITSGPDGEILITDSSEGKVFQLSFPDDSDSGWQSITDISYPMLTANRRSNEAIRNVRNSYENTRRWRWTQPIWDFYNWLGRPFDFN